MRMSRERDEEGDHAETVMGGATRKESGGEE